MAFFEAWKATRLQDTHRKPMGETGLGQAEFIWRKWLAFCAAREIGWQTSTPADVRAFSGDITPRKMDASSQVSPVTLRRYWRVLNDLYAYALLSGRMAQNPASGVMPAISEKTSSLALPPHMWTLLQAGLPGGEGIKDRRNRLVLLLMMRCALTVTEIISLTLGCVQAHEGTPEVVARRLALAGLPLFEPDTGFMAPLAACPTYTLQLSGSRPVQTRRLVLDAQTSQALHGWLAQRRRGQGSAAHERLIVGDANGTAITPKGLYNIAQAFMEKILEGCSLAQAGPNTLRNTCIASWLNQGVDITEIQRRCGLKDQSVLIRLQQHIHPPVPH
jgi:site-specific recombinase XerD